MQIPCSYPQVDTRLCVCVHALLACTHCLLLHRLITGPVYFDASFTNEEIPLGYFFQTKTRKLSHTKLRPSAAVTLWYISWLCYKVTCHLAHWDPRVDIYSPCWKHAANWYALVFAYVTLKLWNELPVNFTMTTSLVSFRSSLKTHIFKLAYAWLKLKFSQYPSIHTNYIISHCATL